MTFCKSVKTAAAFLEMPLTKLQYEIRKERGPRRTRKDNRLVYTHGELIRWHALFITSGLTPNEAAKRLGLAPGYLNKLRYNKTGPKFSRKGRRISYTVEDLDKWQAARKRVVSKRAAQLLERAATLIATANSLKSLVERNATVSTEAFE